MRILSMYLPQYHRVKENDEWWGEGYTDWVSTRNSKPLYEGHYQPHVPKDNYYYDLTDKSALRWQADLMKKYGVDGQCIYHYWFKDGRQILERPAEILLESKDIDMPFCFCWANQSWANSWSAIKGAAIWCDDREQQKEGSGSGLLLEQQYGEEEDWVKHFNYLLPFFQDKRYIKHERKPVFVLYQACFITVLREMTECWNNLAKEAGFEGMYIIGASNKDEGLVDNVLYPSPQTAMSYMTATVKGNSQLRQYDYKELWECLIHIALKKSRGTVGAFSGYDDTPRRGMRGCIIDNASPKIFQKYLTELMAINEFHGQAFTFINAWNEWGEGMHLEPDEKNGFGYLEAVLYAKSHFKDVALGVEVGIAKGNEVEKSLLNSYIERAERYTTYWKIMDKWLALIEKGSSISDILQQHSINRVIIYGVGMLGRHLVCDLAKSNLKIVCALDQKVSIDEFDFPVYTMENGIIEADVVIVTVCYDYDNIKNRLLKKGYNHIISLDMLLDGEI